MRLHTAACIALLAGLGSGCSQSTPAPEPSAPEPPAQTVFAPLTQDLDKAKQVQATVDAETAKTRQAVDALERGDPAN